MLKKVNRLKKKYQFNYVYKNGAHFSSKSLVLYTQTSKTKNIKVGFAVTKKIGDAYKRNLVKRRLREIVYKQIPSFKQHYNIIVVAKEIAFSTDFKTLEFELIELFKKADLFNINEKDI